MALKKHLFWYSISSIFSFCIGFVKLPLYTTHFSPQNFGYYSLVTIGYSFISIVCLNWAGLSLWRFYILQKEEGRLRALYSTILKLFLLLAAGLFLASFTISFFLTDPLLKKLIFFGGISFISTELANIALSHLKINQRSKLYTIITCVQVLLAFTILLLLTFVFNFGIESFFISVIVSNVLILLFYTIFGGIKIDKLSPINTSIRKEIVNYTKIIVVVNLSFSLLINVDRYLINFFKGAAATGIYNQVYNIAQIGMFAAIQIFFSAINPYLIRLLSTENNTDAFRSRYRKLINLYLAIFLPLCFYLCIYSKEICEILLGTAFEGYYYILPPIAISNLFLGITFFCEAKDKFQNLRKQLYRIYLSVLFCNILLNVILLQLFSFEVAAIATLLSSILFFLIYYFRDLKNYIGFSDLKKLLPGIAVLLFQTAIHYGIRLYYAPDSEILFAIMEGILFSGIYYAIMRKRIATPDLSDH